MITNLLASLLSFLIFQLELIFFLESVIFLLKVAFSLNFLLKRHRAYNLSVPQHAQPKKN